MNAAAAIAPRPIAGLLSFALGAGALLLVLVHFWAGPFAPQQRTTVTIGQVAAEIRQSAIRAMRKQPPPTPEAPKWDADRLLKLIAAVLAGLAVISGLAGFVRRETWRPAAGGIALGAGAITFQLLTWTVLLITGAIILFAIITSIKDILGE